MMPCQLLTVLCAVAIALPTSTYAQPRELTNAERLSLLGQAQEKGVPGSLEVLEAFVEEEAEGPGLRGEAILLSEPRRIGRNGCIASTFVFVGNAGDGQELIWERNLDYPGDLYWQQRANCMNRSLEGSVLLGSPIDTDALERIIGESPRIFYLALSYLSEQRDEQLRRSGRIAAIEVEWSPSLNIYLYEVSFTVTQCLSVHAHIRLRDKVELVEA